MARTVLNNKLTPGSIFFVRGRVGYSRISRLTTDEEREKANKTRAHKIDNNYTTITLYNAQALCKNPQQPTLEEVYASESLYPSSKPDKYPGMNFTAVNKSSIIPKVGVLAAGSDPNNQPTYEQIKLTGELAKDTDVTVVVRVFAGQYGNNGVSLDAVLINQPEFSYFGGNVMFQNTLADYGITFEALPPAEDDNENNATNSGNPQAQAQAPAQTGAAAPQQVSGGNPFNSYGAVPQTPVANNGVTPPPYNYGTPAPAPAPAPAPTPVATPPQQPLQFGVGPTRTY